MVDFAHQAKPGLTIIRSGERVQLPPGSSVTGGPPGLERGLSPEGVFVGHMVGAYSLSGKPLVVNLLDERESDTAGKSQELAWTPSTSARSPIRQDWAGRAAGSSLVFLLLAWLLQLRPE